MSGGALLPSERRLLAELQALAAEHHDERSRNVLAQLQERDRRHPMLTAEVNGLHYYVGRLPSRTRFALIGSRGNAIWPVAWFVDAGAADRFATYLHQVMAHGIGPKPGPKPGPHPALLPGGTP